EQGTGGDHALTGAGRGTEDDVRAGDHFDEGLLLVGIEGETPLLGPQGERLEEGIGFELGRKHIDETHSLHTACFRGLVGTLPKHTTRRAHGVLYVVYSPLSVVPWRGRVSSYPTRPSSRTVARDSVRAWTEASRAQRENSWSASAGTICD